MKKNVKSDPFYNFGLSILEQNQKKLTKLLPDVKKGGNPEQLHKLRITTRKISSALEVFGNCFNKKDKTRYLDYVKTLTGALGAARDSDVQIIYLNNFVEKTESQKLIPGIKRLIVRIEQKRKKQQSEVNRVLKSAENSEVLKMLNKECSEKKKLTPRYLSESKIFKKHMLSLTEQLVSKIKSYEPFIFNPERVFELHELRKINKQLRYTLDIFLPVYGTDLEALVKKLVIIHELLGTIHDCDVWLDMIPVLSKKEVKRTIDFYGHHAPFAQVKPGIDYFLDEVKKLRNEKYDEFIKAWNELNGENFWVEVIRFFS